VRAFDKIRQIKSSLEKISLANATKEAEEIVLHVLKTTKVRLFTENPLLTEEQIRIINSLVQRRLNREPLEYMLGECDFCNIRVKVGPGVLIPRPETEIIVEEFKKNVKFLPRQNNRILDLCTGSGCIALSIAREFPELRVFGVDISIKALSYASANKKINDIKNVHFIGGNLFSPFRYGAFAAITANPPYVTKGEIEKLQVEVRDHEPHLALNGGEDGLLFYRQIIRQADMYLLPGGLIFFEMGIGQISSIRKMAENEGYEILKIVKDLAGIDRVMILKRS
jgi:release factor glutamine methyltransferase